MHFWESGSVSPKTFTKCGYNVTYDRFIQVYTHTHTEISDGFQTTAS